MQNKELSIYLNKDTDHIRHIEKYESYSKKLSPFVMFIVVSFVSFFMMITLLRNYMPTIQNDMFYSLGITILGFFLGYLGALAGMRLEDYVFKLRKERLKDLEHLDTKVRQIVESSGSQRLSDMQTIVGGKIVDSDNLLVIKSKLNNVREFDDGFRFSHYSRNGVKWVLEVDDLLMPVKDLDMQDTASVLVRSEYFLNYDGSIEQSYEKPTFVKQDLEKTGEYLTNDIPLFREHFA